MIFHDDGHGGGDAAGGGVFAVEFGGEGVVGRALSPVGGLKQYAVLVIRDSGGYVP